MLIKKRKKNLVSRVAKEKYRTWRIRKNLLIELALEDPQEYRLCVRMTSENFEQILSLTIQKQDTILKNSIPARIKQRTNRIGSGSKSK